jgi:hypothetical protein
MMMQKQGPKEFPKEMQSFMDKILKDMPAIPVMKKPQLYNANCPLETPDTIPPEETSEADNNV